MFRLSITIIGCLVLLNSVSNMMCALILNETGEFLRQKRNVAALIFSFIVAIFLALYNFIL